LTWKGFLLAGVPMASRNPPFPPRPLDMTSRILAGHTEVAHHAPQIGRDGWIRTNDIYLPKIALYQAELHPERLMNTLVRP
jgi:hypothetical protein